MHQWPKCCGCCQRFSFWWWSQEACVWHQVQLSDQLCLNIQIVSRFCLIAQIGAIVCTLIERASCVFHLCLNAFWESQRYSINLFQWDSMRATLEGMQSFLRFTWKKHIVTNGCPTLKELPTVLLLMGKEISRLRTINLAAYSQHLEVSFCSGSMQTNC